ncbi:unnamed protein product, partial [Parascedosporium putredinis]
MSELKDRLQKKKK